MLEQFQRYLRQRELVGPDDRVLVAISGGRDSMALLELMRRTFPPEKFAAAHCNFGLRGEESDGDQELVRQVCKSQCITLYTKQFDTENEARRTNESIQMAARRLRYAWFEELCREHGYTRVAIAHQGDDSVETFFINLMRGTGLRGLTGIREVRGRVIRPLLFATRDQITAWTAAKGIAYRDDSSNHSTKYLRNRVRHDIIPRFSTGANDFAATMEANLSHLQDAQRFIDQQMEMLRMRAVSRDKTSETEERIVIDLGELSASSLSFELHELLYPYGFPTEVVDDLYRVVRRGQKKSDNRGSDNGGVGKEFVGERWVASLDRGRVILSPRRPATAEPLPQEWLAEDDPRLEWLEATELPASLETPPGVAYLCADALRFPLCLRRWQEGDWFIPLGMIGQKKVSDFLIDAKVPLADKGAQRVLVSGQTIVWLVGRRIDDRYKVTAAARKLVRITLTR